MLILIALAATLAVFALMILASVGDIGQLARRGPPASDRRGETGG
ncbi:hypothetical protein [Roseiarcus sp.]